MGECFRVPGASWCFGGWCPVGPDLVYSRPGWGLWGAVPLGVAGPWGSGCIHLPWRQLKHDP